MRYITEKDLVPPYDCPSCGDFNSVVINKGQGLVKVKCLRCQKYEIIVEVPWIDYIDYYCLVSDKWRGGNYEEPIYKIDFDHNKDMDKIEILKNVTLGKILIEEDGKEPIELKNFLAPYPFGGEQTIHPWREIIKEISNANKFFTPAEINERFVDGGASDEDVKDILEKAVHEKMLSRVWHEGMYWYGVRLE